MEEKEIKYISVKEFREEGFLQEVNRNFLHPLGLALEVIIDDNGNEVFGGIWDYRDDPEGLIYDLKNSDPERIKRFKENFEKVYLEFLKHKKVREELLGDVVETIN